MVQRVRDARRAFVAVVSVGMVWMGCGSSSNGSGFFPDTGLPPVTGPDGGPLPDGTVSHNDGPISLGNPDAGKCVPPTCAELHASCGPVTDTKCTGPAIQCGDCPTGESCGGGGVHNKCGAGGGSEDGCTKMTCESQKLSCGAAGDGCGGMLSCGSCSSPQTCGGDPTKPGQCGCTGLCAQIPNCVPDGGVAEGGTVTTTTLSGKVYDPAGVNGLYNALVYIPNNPADPGLQPFPAGINCDICGSAAAGDPLVTAYTAADGTFTLTNVPVGASVPLVIQLGRWRRQFTVPITASCGANTIPDKTLEMPSNHTQGDLPRIALLSGAFDPVECVLRKIGVADSEFGDADSAAYIQFYQADDPTYGGEATGARYDSATTGQSALFAATGGPGGTPQINNYDITILECEGYPAPESAAQQNAVAAYAAAGGRVFGSDFAYSWINSGPLSGAANWNGDHSGAGYTASSVSIEPPPTNPVGTAFQAWLVNAAVAGASGGTVAIDPAFPNATSVIAPTQTWLLDTQNNNNPIHFTYNAPIGGTAAQQCGKVTFSDWHSDEVEGLTGTPNLTFPSECPSGSVLTPEEAILEFMIFDLSACVQPYTPLCTPKTCMDQGIECGPAGDGCGNALSCGTCSAGTCGGGGSGKCGTGTSCKPETCAEQKLQCGPAGDGCGNQLNCGNCPTGDICGLTTPGVCASTSK